jgi:hypothetical protein
MAKMVPLPIQILIYRTVCRNKTAGVSGSFRPPFSKGGAVEGA